MANFNYDKVPEPFLKMVVEHVQYLQSERTREDDVPNIGGSYRHGNTNGSIDYSVPMLKPIVYNTYPIFVIQYSLLSVFSICSNLLIIFYVMRFKLYRDVTQAFLINLAFCYFVQSIVVLPLSLTILLIQNWIFGQFLCFFLPMLQDIPLHVVLITHLLIAWDRYRWLSYPLKARLPAFVCSCASWLTAIIIALPYPIYMTFIDLGIYFKPFKGVGICFVNLADDMEEYMRGLFVIMYVAPVTILGYLYIKTERELRHPDDPLAVEMFKARADARNKIRQKTAARHNNNTTITYDLFAAEVEIAREKRTQKYIGSMACVHIFCVCPLMLLKLARLVLEETYENGDHLDLTYLMFVWIAFLPAAIIPWIYATWMISRPTKQRLRNYFGLSSLHPSHSVPNSTAINESTLSNISTHKTNVNLETEHQKGKIKTTKKLFSDTSSSDETMKTIVYRKSILKNGGDKKQCDLFATNSTMSLEPTDKYSNITTSTYCNQALEQDNENYDEVKLQGKEIISHPLDRYSSSNGGNTDKTKTEISDTATVLPINRRLQQSHLQNSDFNDASSYITESEYSSRKDSTSTLSRDFDIIDLLERERSMDIQDMLEKEKRSGNLAKKPTQMVSRYTQSSSPYLTGPDIDGRGKSPLVYDDDHEAISSSRKNSSSSKRSTRSVYYQELSPNYSSNTTFSYNTGGSRERILPMTPVEVEKLHRTNSGERSNSSYRNTTSTASNSTNRRRDQRYVGQTSQKQPIYQHLLGPDRT